MVDVAPRYREGLAADLDNDRVGLVPPTRNLHERDDGGELDIRNGR